MAETVIAASLRLDAGQATQSVKSIKTELREAQANLINMQRQFGATSAQALTAARSVAELRDQVQEANEVAALFDPGRRFLALGNAVRSAAGGITALTGAMALFGGESEEVQKTLLKVQGALALTEGLNTIVDAAKDFDRLKEVAVDTFKSIKAAIGASGIGLFVVALGLIVAYWDDIRAAVGLANAAQLKALETAKKQVEAEQSRLDLLNAQESTLRRQGVSETAIIDARIAGNKMLLEAKKKELKLQEDIDNVAVKSSESFKKFFSFFSTGVGMSIGDLFHPEKVKADADKTNAEAKIGIAKIQSTVDEDYLTKEKKLSDFNLKIHSLEHDAAEASITDQFKLNQRKAKDAYEAAIEQNKIEYTNIEDRNKISGLLTAKFNAEQAAAEKAHTRQLQDDLRKIRFDGYTASITDQNLVAQLQVKFQLANDIRQTTLEISNKKDRDEKIAALQMAADQKVAELRNRGLLDIEKKLRDIRIAADVQREEDDRTALDAMTEQGTTAAQDLATAEQIIEQGKLDAAGVAYNSQLVALTAFYAEKKKLVKEGGEAERKLTAEYERQKTIITQIQNEARLKAVAQVLGNAAALFEKNTIAYKAFAVAQTVIDTYASATSSYRSLAGIPIVGPALGFAAAAVAVAAGLANVNRILSVDATGGSTSAPTDSGSSVSAPLQQTPQVGNTQLPQGQLNQIGNAANPARAFVIESDVTNNQERVKRLNRASRLGA